MPFGRKDKSKDKSTSERKNRSDVAGLFTGGAVDFNDEDLEAELLALEGKPPKGKKSKGGSEKKLMSVEEIEKMAAKSLRDVDDDVDMDGDDDEDFDDDDLLAELEGMEDEISFEHTQVEPVEKKATPPAKLPKPIERQPIQPPSTQPVRGPPPASATPTSSKVTPTPSKATPTPSKVTPTPSKVTPTPSKATPTPSKATPTPGSITATSQEDKELVKAILMERYTQYREVAQKAKSEGRVVEYKNNARISVQFNRVMKALAEGNPVDLSQMPQPPPGYQSKYNVNINQMTLGSASQAKSSQLVGSTQAASKPGVVGQKQEVEKQEVEPQEADPSIPIPKSPLEALHQRLTKYKSAVNVANAEGNGSKARRMGRIVKQYEEAIRAEKSGKTVCYSDLPTPPGFPPIPVAGEMTKAAPSQVSAPPQASLPVATPPQAAITVSTGQEEEEEELVDPTAPQPNSPLEALQQRLAKYKSGVASAQAEGNSGKARRMGRIVKQYEETIRDVKRGKDVDFAELPTPPGYPPIPVGGARQQGRSPQPPEKKPQEEQSQQTKPNAGPSRNAQQLALLNSRYQEYKSAALAQRDSGSREEALRLLKYVKDLKGMIEIAQNGLPIDESTIPPSLGPTEASGPSDSLKTYKPSKASEGDDSTFDLIEEQLTKQIELCETNAVIYEKSGNRQGASRFRNMEEEVKQELLTVKGIKSRGLAPPKFTIETRTISLLHSLPRLSSNQCEVEVIKLLDVPQGQSLYVEVEFPWPSDATPKQQTKKVKDEVNPLLESSHLFDIDRKQKRSLGRALSRNGIKLTLWLHKALWKDSAYGTAVFKTEDLETKSEVSQVLNFFDGRKQMEAKLEVAVRLREPLGGAQVEEKEVQWLSFSEQIVKKSKVAMPKPKLETSSGAEKGQQKSSTPLSGPIKLEETLSLEVLKYEYQQAAKNPQLQDAIRKKSAAIQQKLKDRSFVPNYKKALEATALKEAKLAQQYSKAGKQREAEMLQHRAKLMQQESKKY